MSDKRNSVSISGAGAIGGGTYSRVSISGAGKVRSDLTVEELKISGAGQIVASGSAVFGGDVIAEEMRVSGSARVDGRAKVKELKCSGTLFIPTQWLRNRRRHKQSACQRSGGEGSYGSLWLSANY